MRSYLSQTVPFLLCASLMACADVDGESDALGDDELIEADALAEGELAVQADAAAPKGGGLGGSIEIALDFNRWTDQMLGWIHKKADSDHYHSTSDTWLFFEGNHCSQNLAGSLWSKDHGTQRGSIKGRAWFVNDEARSVLVNKGKKGQLLKVADDSAGTTSDDYAHVLLKRNIPGAYCVGTFEASYEDSYVRVTYHRKNGLDGKISWVSNY
jgi:hypothetical protein